jgi:hypothetical protein
MVRITKVGYAINKDYWVHVTEVTPIVISDTHQGYIFSRSFPIAQEARCKALCERIRAKGYIDPTLWRECNLEAMEYLPDPMSGEEHSTLKIVYI